jgi:uncharacterized membrane protein (UPF0127 family)
MNRWFAALALAFLTLAPTASRAQPAAGQPQVLDRQPLEIVTKGGVRMFSVEFAKTDDERARGLMFRKELPAGHGMLFDFSPEKEVTMWMKDTLIPLDMLFIRADGRIHRIEANTKPHSLTPIGSNGPVVAVLEVSGGTARKLGIVPGDRVIHPLFKAR